MQYMQHDIVDANRATRTSQEKTDYKKKISDISQDLTDERLIRFMDGLLSYRETKTDDAPVLIPVSYVMVTEDGKWALNMRSWPSQQFDVVGKLDEWSVVKVSLEMNGWYEIDTLIDGKRPWIMGEYVESVNVDHLNTEKPSIPAPTSDPLEQVIKTIEVSPNDIGSLRVRSWASSDTGVLWSLKVWDQAEVLEEKNGYFRIDRDGEDGWIAVNYVHLAGTPAPTHHLTKPTTTIDDASTNKNKQAFLDTYRHLVDSADKPLIDLCTKYYDQVDAIAREYDFPVELIIATWFREHTCKFYNPGNGRGNFQIISRYYPPGDITRAQFEQQVIDFINFSYGKWKFYDQTQNFWPLPISLSYDSFDLLSIRKQAIYYNGIVGTPENNKYANQNFNGIATGGADGIVATFLKVLKYGLER